MLTRIQNSCLQAKLGADHPNWFEQVGIIGDEDGNLVGLPETVHQEIGG